ncbi:hypothetical protein [Microbacterium sp. NPDC076895]|uniref:hypothetical protein n=1 Tax=Microbacterium sp. NPDC076895 TaxID=3154957 RepID=UPI0034418A2B
MAQQAEFWTWNIAVVISIIAAAVAFTSAGFTAWNVIAGRRDVRRKLRDEDATAREAVRSWVEPTGRLAIRNLRDKPITGVQVTWAGEDKFPRVFVLSSLDAGKTHIFELGEVPAGVVATIEFSIENGALWRSIPGRAVDADLPKAEPVTKRNLGR